QAPATAGNDATRLAAASLDPAALRAARPDGRPLPRHRRERAGNADDPCRSGPALLATDLRVPPPARLRRRHVLEPRTRRRGRAAGPWRCDRNGLAGFVSPALDDRDRQPPGCASARRMAHPAPGVAGSTGTRRRDRRPGTG